MPCVHADLPASDVMPRTTLDIDSVVLQKLRSRAAREGKSMGQLASEILASVFARIEFQPEPRPLRWPARSMGPCKIDLEDKEALWLFLDREQLEKGER